MNRYTRYFAVPLLGFLALFTSFATAQPLPQGVPAHIRQAFLERFDDERLQKLGQAIAAQERHSAALLRMPGIVGTGVSWNQDDEAVVKVYTDFGTSGAGIPQTVDGLPVIVEQIGKVYALNVGCELRDGCVEAPLVEASADQPPNQRDWHPRPVPIGVSTGHVDVTGGTLACRVSNGCHTYALSNAHVYANENAGLTGDTILQPGDVDGGIDPDDAIAVLAESIPIVMSTKWPTNNYVDAAIAETTTGEVGTATRTNGYGTPKTQTLAADVGMDVMKYGRTTAITYGYISDINVAVNITYEEGTALFKRQVLIQTVDGSDFSKSGDSGSLIVASGGTNDRRPVGLLFAAGEGITVANEINEVLTAFSGGLNIDGESP
jgi:hypothetical protein